MLTKTLFAGLCGAALATFEVDLRLVEEPSRLLAADGGDNGTNGTTADAGTADAATTTTAPAEDNNTTAAPDTTAAPAATAAPTASNETEGKTEDSEPSYNATSTVRVSFDVPQEVDLGLANATNEEVAKALNVLCANSAFVTAQKTGMVGALSHFDGLTAEHLTLTGCAQSAAARRVLTAASGKTALDVKFRMDAPKTAAFAQHLSASLAAGENLEDIVAKEVVKTLVAKAATIAGFSAQAMKDAAADPAFATALGAAGLDAAMVDAVVEAAKVAVVDVKADSIKATTGAGTAISKADADAYTSRAPSTSSSTSGSQSTAVMASVAILAGALLF